MKTLAYVHGNTGSLTLREKEKAKFTIQQTVKKVFMEIATLREKLHVLIDTSSEEKLKEVYRFFEEEYTDEFKAELDDEYADYQKNGEVISKEDVDKAIDKLLYGKRNNV
ncbi:MAG: hypothetical protein ICV84_24360 [Flavisolibacter sp.]|nr:hypothetical protein [Flavisolibacter sp.]